MPRGLVVLLAIAAGLGSAVAAEGEAKRLRVLILTGRNNHNWKATTPALKEILEGAGRFAVDVTTEPEKCDAAAFAPYDVLLCNWSNWPKTKDRDWGADTEKAFLDAIRGGKGFVVFHAGAATFHAWPEFQQLAGSTWKLGQTGHGSYHEFKVTITDKAHPITKGMKGFTTTDELWHRVGVTDKLNVLCTAFSDKAKGGSGADEPAAHWREFGKGRCFHLILGHDARSLKTAGERALMLRGTEWAATGKVTIPLPPELRAEP